MNFEPLRLSSEVKASVSDDGLILLDLAGGLVLSSNVVGARIWQMIERGHPTAVIAQQLVDDYAIPAERARRDVDAFVADLVARGLADGDRRP